MGDSEARPPIEVASEISEQVLFPPKLFRFRVNTNWKSPYGANLHASFLIADVRPRPVVVRLVRPVKLPIACRFEGVEGAIVVALWKCLLRNAAPPEKIRFFP